MAHTERWQRYARLIIPRIGSNLPPIRKVEEDVERIERLLQETACGGLVLFNGTAETSRNALQQLASCVPHPLLIASDLERGTGQQLLGRPLFPHAQAFAMAGSDAGTLVARYARWLAVDAQRQGIHIVFAPVADVNSDPRNPIIATRSYGHDPIEVSKLVRVFVANAQRMGISTCPKHFPGHGNTHQDSHDDLPVVTSSREELFRTDIPPFQFAIAAKCDMIMSCHVAFPALDPSGLPATLSAPILRGLLREELGFSGVVVSDSLLMAGVRQRFGTEGEMAVAALRAGIDWLLDIADPRSTAIAIAEAVENGSLPESLVEESLQRVLKLDELIASRAASSAGMEMESGESLALEVARRAIRIVTGRELTDCEPIHPDQSLAFIHFKPIPAYGTEINVLEQELRRRFTRLSYVVLGANPSTEEWELAGQAVESAENIVVAGVVKPAAWHRFGLPPDQLRWIKELSRRKMVDLVSFGVAEWLREFSDVRRGICTYSDVGVSQTALAEFLGGQKREV
jgi:beta-N-acetylhexosaminidase